MESDGLIATTAAPTTPADDALLRATVNGDHQAFEALFLRHYPAVYRVARRVTGNHEDAEEVTLDAFTQIYRGKLDPARGNQLSGWLYRTVTNQAFNLHRSRQRQRSWWQRLAGRRDAGVEIDDPAEVAQRRESAAEVRGALAALPERQRNAIVLRASGLSYAEIAAAIDVRPSSVGTLIARGERKLKETMTNESDKR